MVTTMASYGLAMGVLAIPFTPSPLFFLRVLSPAALLLSTLSIIPARPVEPRSPSPITSVVAASRTPRRALILALLSLAALTYFLDGLRFVITVVSRKEWPLLTGEEIGAVEGLVAFAGLAALGAWKDIHGVEIWLMKRVRIGVAFALLLDIAQSVLLGIQLHKPLNIPLFIRFVFPTFRVLLLIPLYVALANPRVLYLPIQSGEEAPAESSLLLPSEEGNTASTGISPLATEASKYGTFRASRSILPTLSGPTTRAPTPAPSTVRVPHTKSRSQDKEEVALDPSWSEVMRRFRRITPYLWPSKSRTLQLLASFCILLVAVGRVVNWLTPKAFGETVRIFEEGSKVSPWPYLFAYVGLRFLQATGGLAALRDTFWAPVMQYSDREMSQLSFDHLLNLSFSFHTRRKTGEILRILDRGAAINHTLELILFNIIPIFLDIIIALITFSIYFEWTLTLIIFFVMTAYVSTSIVLTQWRTKLRRQMNERDVVTRGIHTDCLLNYETVKYFGGEQHEGERYADAIRQYQAIEYKVLVSLNLLNLIQNFIITLGLLVSSMIVALRVTRGQSKPSEFVYFATYLAQLYAPLNMLGYIYRQANQSLVDTEKLLKLLNEPTDVNDKPGAPDLIVEDGEIEFENVSFSYDGGVTALENVSFKVPKGSSVALVGESGSGKSTILRLLYRFYDLKEGQGRILIDGKDIRDVTQASLRQAIGVVPQDSVLFNASISYNIGYGKFGASEDEIEAAAKAAQMHDRILSFPEGYDTKVGERGVRLSGGEKQRVAIARTLLKNPPILLLDEATSALDTSTEKDIQKALQNLVEGRSSLSIAHRLSTIASADLILVLNNGRIVEQGTHSELVAQDGVFATMWADQISTADDATSSHKRDLLTGYSVDEDGYTKVESEDAEQAVISEPPVETPEPTFEENVNVEDVYTPEPAIETEEPTTMDSPVAFPSADAEIAETSENVEAPVTFPISDNASAKVPASDTPSNHATPVAFPGSDSPAPPHVAFPGSDISANASPSLGTQSPGVTFQDTATPPRIGTPDIDQDGKRKRTLSTQGMQRLARRLSLSGRRQTSNSSVPQAFLNVLKRENTTTSKSSDKDKDKDKDNDSTVQIGVNEDGTLSASGSGTPARDSVDSERAKIKKDKKKRKSTYQP